MPVLESILEFFRHESCGKCIPCRVGTAQLTELAREASALPRGERSELLKRMVEEARFMDKTSLCPLGKSPILPLASLERLLSKEL
jgi:NADH:ubiquinone oxidoreductase subunit F (NADH-binding)